MRPHNAWFALYLSGRFDPFTTEKVYIHVYVRYESRFNQCPYPPFPFPTYYPDTGTGSGYFNRTLVEPLTQPLSNQTSRLLTPLRTLSLRQIHIFNSSSPTRLHVGRFDHRSYPGEVNLQRPPNDISALGIRPPAQLHQCTP
jgi:hypothetical protein